jgi:hypothetical protein
MRCTRSAEEGYNLRVYVTSTMNIRQWSMLGKLTYKIMRFKEPQGGQSVIEEAINPTASRKSGSEQRKYTVR